MRVVDSIAGRFAVPVLTKRRIWFAFAVAVVTDSIQLALGPFGWVLIDQGLDVLAMVLTCATLGFHMLLLPTFVLELFPVADMLPTWTGCVAAVVMLRKRVQEQPPPVPPPVYNLDPRDVQVKPMPESPARAGEAKAAGSRAGER